MSFEDDLRLKVKEIFRSRWETRDGEAIPDAKDVGLGNDAVKLNATVLYADLADSTGLVDKHSATFAAEVYKSYLHCAAKIIRSEDGEITAYDGDRIMAVFLGGSKNTQAANAALKINFAVTRIINPELKEAYPKVEYAVTQSVGVDTSDILVARTGIRGSNDLVWVGRAANYAAKLCGLRKEFFSSWITGDVFDSMNKSVKESAKGESMWEEHTWTAMNKMRIYRSSWWRKVQ